MRIASVPITLKNALIAGEICAGVHSAVSGLNHAVRITEAVSVHSQSE